MRRGSANRRVLKGHHEDALEQGRNGPSGRFDKIRSSKNKELRIEIGGVSSSSPADAEDALSNASTPVKESSRSLSWTYSSESFSLVEGQRMRSLEARTTLPVLQGRLSLTLSDVEPRPQQGVHFFTMDKVMRYMPFCADFGPFNLGMTHHFCETLRDILLDQRFASSKIVYCTGTGQQDATNAIYLIGSFLVSWLGASPSEAWLPFSKITNHPCMPYRDATWVPSTYDIHVRDCWAGLVRAQKTGLYDPEDFDKDEYFYYDHPTNGDMHEVVKGKFFAFKGPSGVRRSLGFGRYTLIPTDYCDVFRCKDIKTVVRLNNKEYDRNALVKQGFNHYDLFFTDCTTPSDSIVNKFLSIAEREGAVAVHCLAGLGRTGTLIALYMMKHHGFTANESIAWLRICRPGSVIGPQQQYLKDQEERMWNLGKSKVFALGMGDTAGGNLSPVAPQEPDGKANSLAEMVAKGMQDRDTGRIAKEETGDFRGDVSRTVSLEKSAGGSPKARASAMSGKGISVGRTGSSKNLVPSQPQPGAGAGPGGQRPGRPLVHIRGGARNTVGVVNPAGGSGPSRDALQPNKGTPKRQGSGNMSPAGAGVAAVRQLRVAYR